MFTERLEIRLPRESDRDRFVECFCSEAFMEFSGGVLDPDAGHERFDTMLVRATELPFAKQPIIERASGKIVGYAGVDTFEFEGEERLEFGWRLVPGARGRGYATEATTAVLGIAQQTFSGEILAMIDPRNDASKRVARKAGFTFWKEAVVNGFLDGIYRHRLTTG